MLPASTSIPLLAVRVVPSVRMMTTGSSPLPIVIRSEMVVSAVMRYAFPGVMVVVELVMSSIASHWAVRTIFSSGVIADLSEYAFPFPSSHQMNSQPVLLNFTAGSSVVAPLFTVTGAIVPVPPLASKLMVTYANASSTMPS